MVNNIQQPTILVKKADGTSVRMTMEELKAYKAAQSAPAQSQTPAAPAPKPAPASVPAQTAPAPNKPQPPKPMPPVKKELPRAENIQPPKPAVLASAPAPVAKPVAPAQTAPTPKKPQPPKTQPPKPQPQKVQEIKKPMRPMPPANEDEKMFEEGWEAEDNKSLLEDLPAKENLSKPKEASYVPATSVPVKDIFVDEAKAKAVADKKKIIDNIIKFDAPAVKPEELIIKKSVEPVYTASAVRAPDTKTVIQDVKPPQATKQSVGPVDELGNFTLVDFRRLEVNSKAAGLKMIEKFETLKQDSYLLFMEGQKAWYNSPLYKQYQEVLYQSLARGKSVNEILQSGNVQKDLKPDEFRAILGLNEAIL